MSSKILEIHKKDCIFVILYGALAEWLGTGLQNLGQRFDSAMHLKIALTDVCRGDCL